MRSGASAGPRLWSSGHAVRTDPPRAPRRDAGHAPAVDERLVETRKGRRERRPRDEVKAREGHVYDALRRAPHRFRYPGGEALHEHQRRVRAALQDIARGPLPALLVCHAGTIRVALALGLEGGIAEAREITVPNAEPIVFDERLVLPETR